MIRKWMSILCVLGVWLPAFGCAEEDDANSTQVVPEPEPEPEEPLGIEQVQSVLNIQVQEKRLEIQGDKAYRLEIYTITGRLMEGRQKSEYHSVILPNGIYFVILRSDNETKDYKIYVP